MNNIAFVAMIAITSSSMACGRCGVHGSGCRYSVKYVAPAVVAHAVPIAAVKQSDVFIVNNVYPSQSLVPQGSSLVQGSPSYSSLSLPLLDPNAYFSQQIQLSRALSDTNAIQQERTARLFERTLELQAPTSERLAAGQAASQVLRAAGLDPAHNASGGSRQAVVVSTDANGQTVVQQLSGPQIQQLRVGERTSIQLPQNQEQPQAQGGSPLQRWCGSCHGLELASPKGKMFLGDDINVATGMDQKFRKIANRLRSQGADKMPPEGSPQPSDTEKAAIIDEIDGIISKYDK